MQWRHDLAEKTASMSGCFLHLDLKGLPDVTLNDPPQKGAGAGWQKRASDLHDSSASGTKPGQRTGTMGTMDSRISGLSFHSLNSYQEFDIDPNPLSPEAEGYEAIGGPEEPGRLDTDRESEG